MKKRVLFYAFTPFEVISAIAIKENHYGNCNADIILDDSILMRGRIKKNARYSEVFEHVYFCNSSVYFHRKSKRIIREYERLKTTIDPYYFAKRINGLSRNTYDFFITTEVNYVSESIYSYILKRNKRLEVCLMDEGYSSYTYYFRERYSPQYVKNKIKYFTFYGVGKLYGRRFIANDASCLYLYEPNLQCWDECPYRVKRIIVNKKELNVIINKTFGFDYKLVNEFDKSFIYFEEAFFCDRGNGNDIKIIDEISDVIGKDNFMVKLHPRNTINRFNEYKTNNSMGIPWELIAINLDEAYDKVFITFSSGAVLNYKFLVNKSFKTILLYKCIGDEFYHVSDELQEWFEKFAKLFPEQLFIPSSKRELIDHITQIGGAI